MPGSPPLPPERLLRALKYANIPGKGLEAASKRYDIPLTELSKARRKHRGDLGFTDEEMVLAGFVDHPSVDITELMAWFEAVNHDAYGEAEVFVILTKLEAEGWLAPDGDRWRLAREWP